MTLLSLDHSPMREDRLANPDAFAVCPITGFYDYLTTLLESSVNITYSSTNRTSWGYLDIAEASPSMERVLTSDLQSIAADIAASLTRYSHERSKRNGGGDGFRAEGLCRCCVGVSGVAGGGYCVGDGCACFDGSCAGEVVCEEC